jgi:hypothetical protein
VADLQQSGLSIVDIDDSKIRNNDLFSVIQKQSLVTYQWKILKRYRCIATLSVLKQPPKLMAKLILPLATNKRIEPF